MRTTLTIEDDVAVRLERLRRERDTNLKDVVNDALRQGLGLHRNEAGQVAQTVSNEDVRRWEAFDSDRQRR